MKLVKSDFMTPFNLYDDKLNLLVIENKNIFYSFVKELYDLIQGKTNDIVLSKDNVPVKFSSFADLITQFIPFDINDRKIINKLYDKINKASLEAELITETYNIEMNIQSYIVNLCDSFDFALEFDKNLDIKALLKAVNLKFSENYNSLSEKLIDYMINIRELDGDKLFVFVNLSAYISDDDLQLFLETAVNHRFYMLLIENNDDIKTKNVSVNKRIIDNDLCEI